MNCKRLMSEKMARQFLFVPFADMPGPFPLIFSRIKKNHINHSQKNDRGMLIRGKITVKGVSMGGIGFEMAGNCSMQKDVELEVIFTFDDIHSYFIKKMLLVKVVRDKYAGCEFSDSKEYVKALGFYLRP